jgi:hypothetical protein
MIAVKLMGGLGNQMFQYAAARSLALEKKTWVYLDPSFLYEDSKGRWTQRDYELDVFHIKYKFERSGRVRFLRSLNVKNYMKKLSDSSWWFFPYRNFYQPDHRFHPELFSYPKNTYLHGYFQSEKYFIKHEAQIRKDFEFLEPAKERNAEVLEQIRNSFSISIHVRRGDYVTLAAASEFHGLMGPAYYTAGADEILRGKSETPSFFVFSDDPQWCKENIRLSGETVYVDWNTGKQSFEDMRLMSNCKHHVIANSSFSWWGAWLNPSKEKIIVAPKQWFNDASNQTDIVPESWIRL